MKQTIIAILFFIHGLGIHAFYGEESPRFLKQKVVFQDVTYDGRIKFFICFITDKEINDFLKDLEADREISPPWDCTPLFGENASFGLDEFDFDLFGRNIGNATGIVLLSIPYVICSVLAMRKCPWGLLDINYYRRKNRMINKIALPDGMILKFENDDKLDEFLHLLADFLNIENPE